MSDQWEEVKSFYKGVFSGFVGYFDGKSLASALIRDAVIINAVMGAALSLKLSFQNLIGVVLVFVFFAALFGLIGGHIVYFICRPIWRLVGKDPFGEDPELQGVRSFAERAVLLMPGLVVFWAVLLLFALVRNGG